MATVPSPADHPTTADFFDAYSGYRRQVDADEKTALLAEFARLGARTTDCPCGYTPFDSCPIHD